MAAAKKRPLERRRIAFPMLVSLEAVGVTTGDASTLQALLAYAATRPQEHPLTRELGINLDYNVPIYTAMEAAMQLENTIAEYEPDGVKASLEQSVDASGFKVSFKISWRGADLLQVNG